MVSLGGEGCPFVQGRDRLGSGISVSGRADSAVQGGTSGDSSSRVVSEVLEVERVRSEVVVSVSSDSQTQEVLHSVQSTRQGSDSRPSSVSRSVGGVQTSKSVSFSSVLQDSDLVAGSSSRRGRLVGEALSEDLIAPPSVSHSSSGDGSFSSHNNSGVAKDDFSFSGRAGPSSASGGRRFARQDSRRVSPSGSDDDSDDLEDEDMELSSASEPEVENLWSSWKTFEDPWIVLRDGSVPVSLFNRFNKDLIPWERVKTSVDEHGVKWFATKKESNKFNVFPRKLVSDKKRISNFCEQFPHFCFKVKSKSFCKDWIKGYGHVAEFTGDLGKKSELPMSAPDMVKMFESAGTGSSVKSESLKPSLIFYLSTYKELIKCLPVNKFNTESVAPLLSQQSGDMVTLPSDLASEEHTARLNLLSITVVLSAVRGFSALAKNSASPSALEAAGFSLLTGILPFVTFAWNQAYVRFCKARTALRRSVFVQPLHNLATRLVISKPFSRSLFDKKEVRNAERDFQKDNMTWKKLLKLTSKSNKKSGGTVRSRPYRRPFFRVSVPGRGARGRGQFNDRYQQGGQRGAGRAFNRGRGSNKGNRGRGKY